VIAKCLASDPNARYQVAATLASDLRRHLRALPLQGVSNRSWKERWIKWRRRRPHALLVAGLLLAFLAAGLALSYQVYGRRYQARTALYNGLEHLRRQEYESAAQQLGTGLALAEGSLFSDDLAGELRVQLRLAVRVRSARELRQFVEHVRGLAGADAADPREMRAVEAHCRTFWEQRDRIGELLDCSFERKEQVRDDLLDLAVLWTWLRNRLANPADAEGIRHESLKVLAEFG